MSRSIPAHSIDRRLRRRSARLLTSLGVCMTSVLLAVAGLSLLAPVPGAGAAVNTTRASGWTVVGGAAVVPAGVTELGASSRLGRLDIDVALRPRDPLALSEFVAAVSDPSSPLYGRYLSKGEFGPMFGATPFAIAQVSARLRQAGLVVGQVSGNDLILPVSTTVGVAESAFGVSMHAFRLPSGAVVDANTTAAKLPSAIAPFVQSVVGLDNLVQVAPEGLLSTPPAARSGAGTATPEGASGNEPAGQPVACSGATGTLARTAGDIAQAYDFEPLYAAGDFGSGKSIALFELSGFPASDVAAYQRCYGTHVAITYEPEDGGNSNTTGRGALEADVDVEDVIGLDPQLTNVLVYEAPSTPTGILDNYTEIQVNDGAPVVSTSWGTCESQAVADGLPSAEATIFAAMATQHQTVFAASGDSGSEACSALPVKPTETQLSVTDPASQPDVTGVGGTDLSADGDPPGLPPTEVGWQGSGGGISSLWPMPTWQSGKGVSNKYSSGGPCGLGKAGVCREVPDVSADAGVSYAMYNQGKWLTVFGTSLAAPDWAALTALIDDSSASCRKTPVGFLNPRLYKLAGSTPQDFNDVTKGENDALGDHHGDYPATAGYDMVTGIGTPVGGDLAQSLCGGSLWTGQNTATSTFLNGGPSIAVWEHTLYAVSINATPYGTPSQIFYETYNGTKWGSFSDVKPAGVAAESDAPPSITIDKGTPFVAWTDATTGKVEVSSLSHGKWSKAAVAGAGKALSDNGPAITSFGGELFAAWKGHGSDSVWFSIDTGSSWGAQMKVPGASTASRPAITFFPNLSAAVIAWTTTSDKLQFEVYSLFGFGGVATIRGGSSAGPALAVVGQSLYLGFRGQTSHNFYYTSDSPNKLYGGSWSLARRVTGALTTYSPALAAGGPTLYAAWTGQNAGKSSDAMLWYSEFDPT
ncbi:MAG: protease pro-enzyme activation domain-containing protein [Acidimicrobiales bacterium]